MEPSGVPQNLATHNVPKTVLNEEDCVFVPLLLPSCSIIYSQIIAKNKCYI